MEEYIKVNIVDYVNKSLREDAEIIYAQKKAKVSARKGVNGEKIISWSQDSNGNEIIEKVDTIELNPESNPIWYILTKVDSYGNPIVDKNGHVNEWIVKGEVFERKYEHDYGNIFKPKGGIQKFIKTTENIILNQWGSEMKIAQNGYINITNEEDMYGISEHDFNDTYEIIKQKTLRR